MKKIELLAPAGNMESLKAAVAGGCDAIYLGLTSFSARAFAGNFTHEDFVEAIQYCHIRNVRIYVTINTMLFESEMENAKKEVAFLYENDCDGILVQDMGLFHYIRTCYPDFDVHCSTQMHIHNLNGVKQMQKEGASRVVLARETPLSLIKEAVKTGIEIEVFVYGAICISYSGQCLFSSAMKNRSANRGMCAQCCRLQYYKDQDEHFKEGDYILSPKDLNVIEQVPQLIEAGVASLKIEGRMKRPEYVYLVVKTYREAIDSYYENKKYHLSTQRQKDLLLMFNRGFSKGHLFNDDVEKRMSQYRPNHRGIQIGTVTGYHNGKVRVKLTDTLYQHDGLRILNSPIDNGLTAVKIYLKGKLVSMAEAGEEVELECNSRPFPKKGQPLQKTSDAMLLKNIRNEIENALRTSAVRMSYTASVDQPFRLILTDERGNCVTSESEQLCEKAKNAPMSSERIEKALRKTGDLPYEITDIKGQCDSVFLPVSVVNDVRRTAFERLNEKRAVLHIRKGMVPYSLDLKEPDFHPCRILVQTKETFETEISEIGFIDNVLPVINENLNEYRKLKNCVLSSMGDFYGEMENCIAGYTCNIANSYAIAYALTKGCSGVIFSSEISNAFIESTLQAFEERYGFTPVTFRLVYGKRVLMYIKDCFVKEDIHEMQDMHHDVYHIERKDGITFIDEPEPFVSDNPYTYGSYIILNDEGNKKEIVEEAYEEISERI